MDFAAQTGFQRPLWRCTLNNSENFAAGASQCCVSKVQKSKVGNVRIVAFRCALYEGQLCGTWTKPLPRQWRLWLVVRTDPNRVIL
ncbi:hypothetical protein ACMAY7_11305 [Rhodobacteraceae bacterium nBUS_24]